MYQVQGIVQRLGYVNASLAASIIAFVPAL